MRKQIITNQEEAEKLCKLLATNKVHPRSVAVAIQNIDKLCDELFQMLPCLWARSSSINTKEYYEKIKYAFYTYLDPKTPKPISWFSTPDEVETVHMVDTTLVGGFSHKFSQTFEPYLRNRNQYIARAAEFLARFDVQVNGHASTGISFQQMTLRSETKEIAKLKQILENSMKEGADVLTSLIQVQEVMGEMPKHLAKLFTSQIEFLNKFGFTQQMELRSAARFA